MLPCLAIASTVTMKGRSMIEETKNYVEKNFEGAVVRYGDSVTGDTPLLLCINGKVVFKRIDELGRRWVTDTDGKQFDTLGNVETWTERGWTPVHTVIRHKCSKKLFRIQTESGCVCVTEDHSLLDPAGVMLKPKYLQAGNNLLHSFPNVAGMALPPMKNPLMFKSGTAALEAYYFYR